MPLLIDGKKTNNYESYYKHKKLTAELIQLQRFVRGGHPGYRTEIQEVKKRIQINKILA
jgi:hypothetical protein